jgi:hypothetical protein
MKREPIDYPEGFFTSLVREHNWPPMFESRLDPMPERSRTARGTLTPTHPKTTPPAWQAHPAPVVHSQPLVSRTEAKRKRLKFYFTGQPCINHHIVNRYVSTMGCIECARIKAAAKHAAQKKVAMA